MRRLTPQKLLNVCLIIVFLCLVLPLYAVKGISDSMDHAQGTGAVGGIDFKAYYIAADMLRQGKDFYDVEQQIQEVQARGLPLNESFYIYPPLLAILFVPLTVLPMNAAAQVWFFLNVALYGASLFVLWKALGLGRWSKNLPLLWTLAFLFPPALYTIYKGQVNILLLLLLALTYWLHTKGSQRLAGAALGVATMVKVVPVLLLPYFAWRRQYTLCLATVVTISFIGVLGLMVIGIDPHLTYVSSVLPSLAQPRPNPSNQSLGGFFSLLLIDNSYSDNLAHDETLWKAAVLTSSALLVIAVVLAMWHGRSSAISADLEFSLIVSTAPLLANIAWVDLLVLLIFPYEVLYKRALQGNMSVRWILLTILSVLCISFPRLQDLFTNLVARSDALLRNPFAMGVPFYGVLLLWITTIAALWSVGKERQWHGPTRRLP
jgi:hypothetical protein